MAAWSTFGSAVRSWRRPRVHLLHIGKTGGTAVRSALEPLVKAGTYRVVLHGHDTTLDDIRIGERVVFAIRDPHDRFVSGFYSRQRRGEPRYRFEWSAGEKLAFERFSTASALAEALSADDPDARAAAVAAMGSIQHVRDSYWRWFGDDERFRSRATDIAMVLHQERLDHDFERLVEMLSLEAFAPALPDDDVGAHRNPAAVDRSLSDLARKNLGEWYADDHRFVQLCRSMFPST